MDDFYKQKIIWGEISDQTKFSIELEGKYLNEATTFLMVGQNLLYIASFLNSKFSEYFFSKIGTTTGVGTIRWKKFTIEQLYIPKISNETKLEFESKTLAIIESIKDKRDYSALSNQIDCLIYSLFKFTDEEIQFIESQ